MPKLHSASRILSKLLFGLAASLPFLKPTWRARLYKRGGVKLEAPSRTFIGAGVHIDDMNPEAVSIGEYSFLTKGVCILTHFVDSQYTKHIQFYNGRVSIGRHVFIGMNTVIVKPCTIGDGAIIGANSVIACDIPPYEVWGGNPAKFIRKRTPNNENSIPIPQNAL